MLCTSGVARSLVGVAGGATRAAITQHQARENNISDVAAKDGSQETMVNLIALLVNLTILPLLGDDNVGLTWIMFLLLTCFHLFANYRAVKSLQFTTLNQQRLLFILKEYFQTHRVSDVEKVNDAESAVIGFGWNEKSVLGRTVNLGCSFQTVMDDFGNDSKLISNIAQQINVSSYFAFLSQDQRTVNVILSSKIEKYQVLEAYIHGCHIARFGDTLDRDKWISEFVQELETQNWNTNYIQMSTMGWEGNF